MGSRPGDFPWPLWYFSGVCVGIYGLTYSLLSHPGTNRSDRYGSVIRTIKPMRKIKVTICSSLYAWPDVWSGDLLAQKSMVIHETKGPYWDQVLLNNTKPNYDTVILFPRYTILSLFLYPHFVQDYPHPSELNAICWATQPYLPTCAVLYNYNCSKVICTVAKHYAEKPLSTR